jgi:hypothetical protein
MEGVSDHSAVDIAAKPISAGSFFLPDPPFLFEQWTSPWTPDTPADTHRPQVNAEACSLISCGTTALHPLTQVSVCRYSVLFSGASVEVLRCNTLKTLSLVFTTRDSLSSGVRPQDPCTGQHSLGPPQYADFRNLCKHSDLT